MRAPLVLLACLGLGALPASAMSGEQADTLLREHLWRQVRAMPQTERPKVGLVLSAGAVRGVAHVGVIQVLENAGFPIDVVAGTSMGAVVGSFYAAGMDMDSMLNFPNNLTLGSGSNLSKIRLLQLMLSDSLLSNEKFEELMRRQLGDMRFDQTIKPFACVAMDLRTGEKIIFREGPLAPAVRASWSMPGLFRPVHYRHRYLVDGGVVDYIPVDAAKLLGAEWIIASVTEGDFTKAHPDNVLSTLVQIFDIRGTLLSREQRKTAHVVIEPNVGDIRYYDVAQAQTAMEKGMSAAAGKLRGAQESLILFTLPRLWKKWNKTP